MSELFEVAVVVEDLGAAMGGDLARYDPAEPMISRFTLWTPDGSVEDVALLISYTRTGPIRLELIEAIPGSMWEAVGVQHYGWFSDDLAADSALLAGRGMPLIASRGGGNVVPWQFAYHECAPFGTIELVDAAMRPFLEGWWEDGHPPLALHAQTVAELSGL